MSGLRKLADRLERFADERQWHRFHSPKNLSMALAGEVGELLALLQWLTEEESRDLATPDSPARAALEDELADCMIYLVRLADQVDIDLVVAANRKIGLNEKRFPVQESTTLGPTVE